MTCFALGAKCGALAASGLTGAEAAVALALSAKSDASPSDPNPTPTRPSISRRERGATHGEPIRSWCMAAFLVEVEKFIRAEQCLGEPLPARKLVLRVVCRVAAGQIVDRAGHFGLLRLAAIGQQKRLPHAGRVISERRIALQSL